MRTVNIIHYTDSFMKLVRLSSGSQLRNSIFLLLFYMLLTFPLKAQALSEYDVKAGYIYKFLFFVDWPEKAFQESQSIISFGIIGENPFGDSFNKIEGKTIAGKILEIEEISTSSFIKNPQKYQLIFISSSEQKNLNSILQAAEGNSVLTISDIESFLETNGMINFVIKEGNIRFEINDQSIKNAGLNIRSTMKRQAVRIVGVDDGS